MRPLFGDGQRPHLPGEASAIAISLVADLTGWGSRQHGAEDVLQGGMTPARALCRRWSFASASVAATALLPGGERQAWIRAVDMLLRSMPPAATAVARQSGLRHDPDRI